jgi:hypothetical protein
MNTKLVSAKLCAMASSLLLSACGGGDATPISGTTQSEAEALNSAAEMLDKSDDSVKRARAIPQ